MWHLSLPSYFVDLALADLLFVVLFLGPLDFGFVVVVAAGSGAVVTIFGFGFAVAVIVAVFAGFAALLVEKTQSPLAAA